MPAVNLAAGAVELRGREDFPHGEISFRADFVYANTKRQFLTAVFLMEE